MVRIDLFKLLAMIAAVIAWLRGDVSWLIPVFVVCYYWSMTYTWISPKMRKQLMQEEQRLIQEAAWVAPAGNYNPRSN